MKKCFVVLACVSTLLGASCGRSDSNTTDATTTVPSSDTANSATPTTADSGATDKAYAQVLMEIRDDIGSTWTAETATHAAEALNLAVPPEGYAVRHRQLLALFEDLGSKGPIDVQAAMEAGHTLATLDKVSCDIDPTVYSWC